VTVTVIIIFTANYIITPDAPSFSNYTVRRRGKRERTHSG